MKRESVCHDTIVTAAQHRMWLSDELAEDHAANHIPVLYRTTDPVDIVVLEAAVKRLIERHYALRVRFFLADDGLRQKLGAESVTVERFDLADSDEQRRSDLLTELVQREFDLERGPLVRVTVVRSHPHEHHVLLVFHHICVDDWSLRIVLEELWEDYARGLEGRIAVRGPAASYRDYAAREHNWLVSSEASALLEDVVTELAGFPGHLALPGEAGKPSGGHSHGGLVEARLTREETAALERFSRDARCSVFTTLLALYAIVLSQITGSRRFLVVVPVANRPTAEDHDTVGLFTNTVPVGITISRPTTLRSVVEHVRIAVFDALDRQQIPFDRFAARLAPRGRGATFGNVSFGMGEAYASEPAPGIRRTDWKGYVPVRYELAGYVTLDGESATVSLYYDDRTKSRRLAQEWLDRWMVLLRTGVERKDPILD